VTTVELWERGSRACLACGSTVVDSHRATHEAFHASLEPATDDPPPVDPTEPGLPAPDPEPTPTRPGPPTEPEPPQAPGLPTWPPGRKQQGEQYRGRRLE